MIKYIGSKRVLVPKIVDTVRALAPEGRVLDLFSGTSRVGHALKKAGYFVIANDHNTYAYALARCYVQADRRLVADECSRILAELRRVPPARGYFTKTFCEDSRFFRPENGARIDAIREEIARRDLRPDVEAVLVVSLMEAADRVDSTTGVQMAYLKQWAPRAANDLDLRLPSLLDGPGLALHEEAATAAACEADVAYLDPPYNQHSYRGNYHIWETLVRWDEPEHYGVACKRVDCRTHRSDFNSRRHFRKAFEEVVAATAARHLVISFNDEGYLSQEEIEEILARRGRVGVFAFDHKRYVGARIGIYNPSGQVVGKVSHLRNRELLYVVTPDVDALRRVRAVLSGGSQPRSSVPTRA